MTSRPRLGGFVAAAVLAATGALGATQAQAAMTAATAGWRPFAPDSVWNQPLRPDVAPEHNSAAGVDWLRQSIGRDGAWINSSSCGVPIFWADPTTATVPVKLAVSAGSVPAAPCLGGRPNP